ncbi:oligosaccharyl transferase STT3 subunit [Capsaspora owczarzaki ATCC 30864]|uniref:dolichyl-diphosphooligosaccharide--protein glycotransferase n=1 Tax=Capsaspora owczarzaki (strain ATCC 30864) TaxID=595528 RepID=A0A0D2UI70_CAPO3|nr:oligosaccharyl transferase STT3 subunit [Capsaspora owczarzaki ATCC 30864]KJE94826.1 oligosaccharyl transferase STT3 subunit [Capsaspora owczarzaki ATCC 30864]|eukprot:XP_004346072.1 oligosaccharyl transferase STT3 subunit [Capsaspora owczarzaki ATCC 30864]
MTVVAPSRGAAAAAAAHPSASGSNGTLKLLTFTILALIGLLAFASRLFAVIRFESIIHEFDPWFNYRATEYMVTHSVSEFINWFDERAWFPLGRIVGGTVYPGLMFTSGLIHWVMNSLNIPIHIRDVCVFLAPLFSALTAFATFLLTRELWTEGAGLLAAAFIGIVPGYISRSVAGSYDNEGIAIFALLFTYYLWVKAIKTGSMMWAVFCAVSYGYMVAAWGGYVFIINLIPLHVFVLLLMGRYSHRIYVAFSVFYIIGTLLSMQVPFVGFQPVRTSEHMAGLGIFLLLQAMALLSIVREHLPANSARVIFRAVFIFGSAAVFVGVVVLTYMGYIAPWTGRFYSLWDTGYAKIHIPIIASVSEHQPTTWTSFFFDLQILVCIFPAGLWLFFSKPTDERVFIVLYAVTGVYFAGVMVRLMLTLTPVVCILAAVAISNTLDTYLFDSGRAEDGSTTAASPASTSSSAPQAKLATRQSMVAPAGSELTPDTRTPTMPREASMLVVGVVTVLLALFVFHCTWVTSNAYSSPSVVLSTQRGDGSRTILDDFREAYHWLRSNTDDDATIMSWWDYGYQIAGMSNRTTLVDNNTWNNSHIAMVGKAMSSTEEKAYPIMRELSVDYVLIIFGGVIGYSGDDINKFLWMVRIAQGEHPNDIRESDYFTQDGQFLVDRNGSPTLLNSLMYKMCYYRFGEFQSEWGKPSGWDRTRNAEIGNKDISFTHLEEAYTTEHWLVRIYRVKKEANTRNLVADVPPLEPARHTDIKPARPIRRGRGTQGFIKNKDKSVPKPKPGSP